MNLVLKANPSYWGGPNHIKAQIPTININFVPSQSVRDLDIQNAAKSGQAMAYRYYRNMISTTLPTGLNGSVAANWFLTFLV